MAGQLIMWILSAVLGWWLADLCSGLYHLLTDRGYSLPRQVRDFQWHHDHPHKLRWEWWPMLTGAPVLLFWWTPFGIALGLGMSLSQVSHYFAHHGGPWPVILLQRCRIFLTPAHHAGHHQGQHDQNYCILCGWNDVWLNWLLKHGHE